MELTTDNLFTIIGRKQVEIEMLRDHNKELIQELRRLEAASAENTIEHSTGETGEA